MNYWQGIPDPLSGIVGIEDDILFEIRLTSHRIKAFIESPNLLRSPT